MTVEKSFEEKVEEKFYEYRHGMIEFKKALESKSLDYLQRTKDGIENRYSRRRGSMKAMGLVPRNDELKRLKRKLFVVNWLIKEKRKHTPKSKQSAIIELERMLK